MRKLLTLILLLSGWYFASAQCAQFLNIDTSICSSGAVSITADASVLVTQLCGDSLTITFNATGTALSTDTAVYMHSGPQFLDTGWVGAYTVGTWPPTSSAGKMTSIGNGAWSITINPRSYFNYPADSCLTGIFMDFLNTDASHSINNGGNNYFLYTYTGTPTCAFTWITGTETLSGTVSYLWSDGSTVSNRVFTSAGSYTVTATGSVGGCTATGSVIIKTAHAPANLGSDVIRCVPNSPVVLNPGAGFVSYQWLDGPFTTFPTYTAIKPGCYWVTTLDSANCSSYSSVDVENTEVTNLSIPDSLSTCPGGHLSVDASTNVNLHGDSVVIIFNATGTPLDTAAKVYMQTGPQTTVGGTWDNDFTVGTWGLDNGVGEMTSIGNHEWKITVDPYCYYHMNPDTALYGMFVVFRNATGTAQDPASGDNVLLNLTTYPPTSGAAYISVSRSPRLPLTYTWSNDVSGPAQTFSSSGTYIVTLSDNNSCSSTASIVISINTNLSINLGNDTTICPGNVVDLAAPTGFATYAWSDDSTTSSIIVSATGDYAVTATDTLGCQYTGSVDVTVSTLQVSLGSDVFQCTNTPVTLSATPGFASYKWLEGPVGTSSSYVASKPGPYWVVATTSAGCVSSDTISVNYSDVLGLSMPDTASNCPGNLVALSSSTSVEQNGDSLVIIYDASQGETGLVGATKVYMHSSPQFYAGVAWLNDNYVVDTWGADNGVGEMDSISPNHWRIVINPYDYYNIPPDTPLTGIWMVFRNANGTETGKDETGNNILLSLTGPVPTSTFGGIYGFHQSAGSITYLWSDGNTAPSIAVSTPGVYTVTATDIHNCSASASTTVIFTSNLSVSIGNDTTICSGQSVVLKTTPAFSTYAWSVAGDTLQTLTVSAAGTYTVTVADGNCSASASVVVSEHGNVVAIGNVNPIVRCTNNPVTLTASNGFVSYLWYGTGTSSQTYLATNPGLYWVEAVDNIGCISYDSVVVTNSAVLRLTLPDSSVACGNDTVHLDPSVAINAVGDSLIIIYNATLGTSTLQGAAKVYFQSGPQVTPTGNWDGAYTVGTWGLDNGVGEMTSLGNNIWTITIDPSTYFGLPADTTLYGIWMVFRNADGTESGRSDSGTNILLSLDTTAPISDCPAVTGTWQPATGLSGLTYSWSNGVTTSAISITTSGTYTVTVADQNSCSNTASIIVVQGQPPVIPLPADTSVCSGNILDIDGGTGFVTYVWSTGASTEILYVNEAGIYSLTATNASGCSASASITVDSAQAPVIALPADTTVCPDSTLALDGGPGYSSYSWSTGVSTEILDVTATGNYSLTVTNQTGCSAAASISVDSCTSIVVVGCGSPSAKFQVQSIAPANQVTFIDSSLIAKPKEYIWNFGDGDTSEQMGSVVHTYATAGIYTVTLTILDSCGGTSSASLQVDVNSSGIVSISGISTINIYPNPSSFYADLEIGATTTQIISVSLINTLGEIIWTKRNEFSAGRSIMPINTSILAEGVYWVVLRKDAEQTITKLVIAR